MTATLDEQIADLERRIVYEARTIEAARTMHDQLDRLRERRDGRPHRTPIVTRPGQHGPAKARSRDYERGYNSGYRAAQRKAWADAHPTCDHQGIGYPWCATCRPQTIALMRQMGMGDLADDFEPSR